MRIACMVGILMVHTMRQISAMLVIQLILSFLREAVFTCSPED